jgi:hypothetical protein
VQCVVNLVLAIAGVGAVCLVAVVTALWASLVMVALRCAAIQPAR